MWHFIADPHFGHGNIIKYCKRPFLTREEKGLLEMAEDGVIPEREIKISQESIDLMDNTILDSINLAVAASDTLVIEGDFCFSSKKSRENLILKYRERIVCDNVILILGNHDHRSSFFNLPSGRKFSAIYDTYTFNVDGQQIFCSHYPHRSWDKAHHGAWMLYGHVHDLYNKEDNGGLMPYQEKHLRQNFSEILDKLNWTVNGFGSGPQKEEIQEELLNVCASLNGVDYTLDVGVDNRIRGENIPWGTPWSMTEIRDYMNAKKAKWEKRKQDYMNLKIPKI